MTMTVLLFAGYVLTGLLAGIVAGLFGVGGGILIVPALLVLFHMDGINPVIAMQLAVSTSLATIVVTTASATWNQYRRQSVCWPVVRQYLPGVLLGAWLGSRLAVHLDGKLLRTLFGLFELAVGLLMVRGNQQPTGEQTATPVVVRRTNAISLLAILIGMFSTLLGIGGGVMLVPAISIISGLHIRLAVGTSSAISMFMALVGTTGLIQAGWGNNDLPDNALGYVVPMAALGIVCGTLITIPLGVRLAHSTDPRILKKSFGLLLLVVGIKLLWQQGGFRPF